MPTIAEQLLQEGIRARSYAEGNQKLLCPRCSMQRQKRADPCLSLTIDDDGAVWRCHHCQWSGAVHDQHRDEPRRRRQAPPVRPKAVPDDLSVAALRFLANRGISEATARRNRVGSTRQFIAGMGEVECIAFPYYRDAELTNVKFRAIGSKAFTQVKGAEATLYGLDDIAGETEIIIVEGELDKLACDEAGFRNVVSVPNGAQTGGNADDDSPAFTFLANDSHRIEHAKRIILAGDADDRGRALTEELARRLGKERCWRVRWPDGNDAPSKDANATLIEHGADVLRECIAAAEPYPIAGLYSVTDFLDDLLKLYRDGRARGLSTGFPSLDECMRIRPGELSVWSGYPGCGKSEFIDQLTINLATLHEWRFALCSFENPPDEHLAKLAEKRLHLPFWDGLRRRMSEGELLKAVDWINDRFHLIRFDDEAPTLDAILAKARAAVLRHGINGLVIDPYNEIEHMRPANMTETEYVGQLLGRIKRFAQNHAIHVWIVAHPGKPRREDGKLPAPTMYDISGSAHWVNKADFGVIVHRDPAADPRADVYIRKVRHKATGKIGTVSFNWDSATGCYSEIDGAGTYRPKAYRDE